MKTSGSRARWSEMRIGLDRRIARVRCIGLVACDKLQGRQQTRFSMVTSH